MYDCIIRYVCMYINKQQQNNCKQHSKLMFYQYLIMINS